MTLSSTLNMRGKDRILEAMIEKAQELGIPAGAAVFNAFDPASDPRHESATYDSYGAAADWQTTNHLGVALMGYAQSRTRLKDSGIVDSSQAHTIRVGEYPEQGSIICDFLQTSMIFAFAGGTGEENVAVAQAGYEYFLTLFEYLADRTERKHQF